MNIPIYTCASSFPRVNSQVRPSVSAFATRQRREKNRTGRSGRGGRGGRWQVDYGRRSRCLETAGTRDARLLGDQHDAMTSAVWWSGGEAKTENCLCAPNTPIPPSYPPPPPLTLPPCCKCSWKSREMVCADIFTIQSGCFSEQRSRMDVNWRENRRQKCVTLTQHLPAI